MQKSFNQRRSRLLQMSQYRKNKSVTVVKAIPDDLFKVCSECQKSFLYEHWEKNLQVCSNCGKHHRLSAFDRIDLICDEATFQEMDSHLYSKDEENFFEYRQKLDIAMHKSKLNEAVVYGTGLIKGRKCVLCVMDSHFMMGSMGKIVGEKITRSIELATRRRLPIIIVSTSGGARMQEGIMSLMQMAKTSSALKKHSDEGLLYISVLTDPTTGGVSASFAMLGDIILAEPKALIGFAGKRVIEQTISEKLPDDFQTSEFLFKNGFIDLIVNRNELKDKLYQLLMLHEVR